jgi:hypothetical protein
MASRNDDHGANLLVRTQICLDGLLSQLERFHIDSELIMVDWNPPPNKPPLKDILVWPAGLKYCTIRVITVPSSIHSRYDGAAKLPMHVVVAFNCATRRARGEFVLPRAADVLYADELIAFMAAKKLKPDERYRVDRCDVNKNVVNCLTLQERLEYCRNNIIRVNSRQPPPKGLPPLHTNASGDFQLMSRQYWCTLHGYREADIPAAYVDSLLSYASYAAGVREVALENPLRIYHIDHDNKFNNRMEQEKLPLQNLLEIPFMPTWFNRKLAGLYRIILTTFGYKLKSSVSGVATLDYSEMVKICRKMLAGKRSYVVNDESWGLRDDKLDECIINRAEWDKDTLT